MLSPCVYLSASCVHEARIYMCLRASFVALKHTHASRARRDDTRVAAAAELSLRDYYIIYTQWHMIQNTHMKTRRFCTIIIYLAAEAAPAWGSFGASFQRLRASFRTDNDFGCIFALAYLCLSWVWI